MQVDVLKLQNRCMLGVKCCEALEDFSFYGLFWTGAGTLWIQDQTSGLDSEQSDRAASAADRFV